MLVKKEIDGTVYTARYNGYKYATEFYDDCLDEYGNVVSLKLAEKVFREVIIDPPCSVDDFDTTEEFVRVYDFGVSVAVNGGEKILSNSQLRESMLSKWDGYRLIFNNVSQFDYDTVFYRMTPREIAEANMALDEIITQMRG